MRISIGSMPVQTQAWLLPHRQPTRHPPTHLRSRLRWAIGSAARCAPCCPLLGWAAPRSPAPASRPRRTQFAGCHTGQQVGCTVPLAAQLGGGSGGGGGLAAACEAADIRCVASLRGCSLAGRPTPSAAGGSKAAGVGWGPLVAPRAARRAAAKRSQPSQISLQAAAWWKSCRCHRPETSWAPD